MLYSYIVDTIGGYFLLRKKIINSQRWKKRIYSHILKGYQIETGSFLPVNNIIKGEICFPHGPFGVFISQGASIGENCVIFHQVTIGSNTLNDSKNNGSPSIGDNCYIGAGAKIIGNIKIGNNCRIGANCVVVSDIPDNSVVVLYKPRIIVKKNKLNNNFEQWRQ